MIMKRFKKAEEPEEKTLTSDDQDTVRYLINKQTFDGLWDLNSKIIEQLIGKPLSHFQHSTDTRLLVSAIIILVLETRLHHFHRCDMV